MKRNVIGIGVLVTLLVLFALAAASNASKYKACREGSVDVLLDQVAGLEFIVRNHNALEFPSCYRELNYVATRDASSFYVANGTLLGWRAGETTPYCWSVADGYFDCENLCSKR